MPYLAASSIWSRKAEVHRSGIIICPAASNRNITVVFGAIELESAEIDLAANENEN